MKNYKDLAKQYGYQYVPEEGDQFQRQTREGLDLRIGIEDKRGNVEVSFVPETDQSRDIVGNGAIALDATIQKLEVLRRARNLLADQGYSAYAFDNQDGTVMLTYKLKEPLNVEQTLRDHQSL